MTAAALRLAFRCVPALFTAIVATRRRAVAPWISAFIFLFRVFHLTSLRQLKLSVRAHRCVRIPTCRE